MLSEWIARMVGVLTGFINSLGYWGIAVGMAIESCNIPLPSEIILPYGGYLVSAGRLEFFWAAMAGTAGGTFGSVVSYYIGLCGGRPFLYRYGGYFGVTPQKLALAERWFARYGEATVFFTRLLPVIRTFISLPAGVARMNLTRFVVYTFLGSLPWSLLLTYVGYLLGEHWELIGPWFHRIDVFVLLGLAGLLAWYWWRRTRA